MVSLSQQRGSHQTDTQRFMVGEELSLLGEYNGHTGSWTSGALHRVWKEYGHSFKMCDLCLCVCLNSIATCCVAELSLRATLGSETACDNHRRSQNQCFIWVTFA